MSLPVFRGQKKLTLRSMQKLEAQRKKPHRHNHKYLTVINANRQPKTQTSSLLPKTNSYATI